MDSLPPFSLNKSWFLISVFKIIDFHFEDNILYFLFFSHSTEPIRFVYFHLNAAYSRVKSK